MMTTVPSLVVLNLLRRPVEGSWETEVTLHDCTTVVIGSILGILVRLELLTID
jgi:hypothetical protein